MMKKLVVSAVLAALAVSASPASAQYWPDQRRNYDRGYASHNLGRQLAHIERRIQMAAQRRMIHPYEAQRLEHEVDRLNAMRERMAYRGRGSYADLNARVQRLQQHVDSVIGRSPYGRQFDQYNNRYDRDDRYDY